MTREQALFVRDLTPPAATRPLPEWAWIAREKKRKGVTLLLLWQEYRQTEPTGYSYSQFAERCRQWRTTIEPVMRQEYRAGERTFVDYAGVTVAITDPTTGAVRAAQIFVTALGASNFTYALRRALYVTAILPTRVAAPRTKRKWRPPCGSSSGHCSRCRGIITSRRSLRSMTPCANDWTR